MLTLLKSAAKKLPHPLLLRTYALWFRLRDLRRFEALRREAGVPLLDTFDLSARKKSDVLFVLGSGPSINRISEARWRAIARHDSLGFNFWLYHRFVPSVYVTEDISEETPDALARYLQLAAARAADYRNVPKIMMEFRTPPQRVSRLMPPGWRENLYAAQHVTCPARDPEELAAGMRYLASRGYFSQTGRIRTLFKYCSSLTTLLALGLRMGYRKIVLCGVDLSGGGTFYDDARLYPDFRPQESATPRDHHITSERFAWHVPAEQAALTMNRTLLQPAGVELFVEHRSSRLFPEVPEAPAQLFGEAQTGAAVGGLLPAE